MSVVMQVHIKYSSEPGFNAILKLYDRRFGTTLRGDSKCGSEQLAHTAAKEDLFQDSVRKGAVGPVLRAIEEETRIGHGIGVSYRREALDGTPEGLVKYEANLWQKCDKHFDQEAKAYTRLSDLQGKVIPQVYAHIHLAPPQEAAISVPADLLERQETAQYFTVKGLLMQRIDGYDLRDLPVSPLAPPDPQEWQSIVQAAIDAAHAINRQGICMLDCTPFNVVVQKTSQRPFLVDLAQCWFREEIYAEAENSSPDGEDQGANDQQAGDTNSDTDSDAYTIPSEDSNWDPEIGYWEKVKQSNNTVALGAGMARRLLEARGIAIMPKYPDYHGIIATIKSN